MKANEITRPDRPSGTGSQIYQQLAANFTPANGGFFSWLLIEVHHRAERYAIEWYPASFAIQRRRLEEQPVSFAYGRQGQFDVYFGNLDLSPKELAYWRGSLLSFGVFTATGKHTLSAKPSDVSLDRLRDASLHLLDVLAK